LIGYNFSEIGKQMAEFIAYYRVSTSGQAQSGLGLEAQKQAVADFINGNGNKISAEFTEVESGKRCNRPELNDALNRCRETGAKLVIARLDRLARNAAFLLTLRDSGVEFVAADMPDANRLTVGIMALVAEDEAERISQRTKAALGAAKARGVQLGGMRSRQAVTTSASKRKAMADQHAASVAPIIEEIRAAGITNLEGIAQALHARGINTARGGRWHATTVRNVLRRAGAVSS
jgi:DNA invertase Pin-like site-specific DNA recombinase